jgi:hypothetical protein
MNGFSILVFANLLLLGSPSILLMIYEDYFFCFKLYVRTHFSKVSNYFGHQIGRKIKSSKLLFEDYKDELAIQATSRKIKFFSTP